MGNKIPSGRIRPEIKLYIMTKPYNMCLYPRLVKNPKYKPNKKNGGEIPPLYDPRVLYIPVGCQVCYECRTQRSAHWRSRLSEEIIDYPHGKFVTLTFSTQSLIELEEELRRHAEDKGKEIEWDNPYVVDHHIAALAIRRFLERWRKAYTVSLRHWFITELGHGETEHLHIHGIVWPKDYDELTTLPQIWKYGWAWIGYPEKVRDQIVYKNNVTQATINYCIKYMTKTDIQHPSFVPSIFCTHGIGRNYIISNRATENRFQHEKTVESYRSISGKKGALPPYWRNKLWNDEEREKLWIYKIDKEIRYVCKEKVSTANGNTYDYYNLLMYHRDRTAKIGYPAPDFIWKQQEYEHNRLRLLREKRKQQKKEWMQEAERV